MVRPTRETERKYEVPPSADLSWLPGLDRVKGVATVVASGTEELEAVYYDTADLRLFRSRATLRRRTGGADAGWHLKLPMTGDSREEIRSPLAADVPQPLLDLTRSRTRGAELMPLVRIRTDRAVWRLADAEGAALAELAVDAVRGESLRTHAAPTAWREVEVESAGNETDPALLDAVEAGLREQGITRAQSPSKLARALEETGAASAGDRDRSEGLGGSAGEQVLAYVRKQVAALTVHDPAVRLDRPDAVHKMRVACRRLRSCLRSYRTVLNREVTDPVRDELKWLAGELGAERDQEVLRERLTDGVGALPRELVLGPVTARLQLWGVGRGDEAHRRTLDALGSPRYLALLDTLAGFVEKPPLRAKAGEDADRVMAKAVRKEFHRLAGRMDTALSLPPGDERDAALHNARKAAKRARYAAEAARGALGKPAKRLGRSVKAVQSVLGDHHDSVVARATLRELAVAAATAGESAFTWGLLYGREEAVAAARERQARTAWNSASKPTLRKRFSK
ncbi:CHAD domain-containing protein [Streptomyces sp. SAI-170]|uniref:CYTH and CHAD domain-containing protein n=1 Tax=Streptomyces sp. SAI-170 TaxID=3377729 RepID=UPI003C7E3976